jgi:hypothetical protein
MKALRGQSRRTVREPKRKVSNRGDISMEAGTALDCIIERVSRNWAGLTGRPKDAMGLADETRMALASGELETTTWIIERSAGKRTREEVLLRHVFLSWWWATAAAHEALGNITDARFMRKQDTTIGGGYLVLYDALNAALWPLEFFADKVRDQVDALLARWQTRAGGFHSPAFRGELIAALEAEELLAVLCWEEETRTIRREDFVPWYEGICSCSSMLNALTGLPLATGDDLWPAAARSGYAQDLKGFKKLDAATLAIKRLFPSGLPRMTKPALHSLRAFIAEAGFSIEEKTWRRAHASLKIEKTDRL